MAGIIDRIVNLKVWIKLTLSIWLLLLIIVVVVLLMGGGVGYRRRS